jgi:hypothetical protein
MAWKKQIQLRKVKDNIQQTYWYDLTNSGIVKQSQRDANWEWLKPLNEAIETASKRWDVPPHFLLEPIVPDIEVAPSLDLKELK